MKAKSTPARYTARAHNVYLKDRDCIKGRMLARSRYRLSFSGLVARLLKLEFDSKRGLLRHPVL